jgi:hypothetical protein
MCRYTSPLLALAAITWLAGCSSAGHGLAFSVATSAVAGANPLLPTNSYDAHIRNLLLAGKVPEALSYAREHCGRIPSYLQQYAAAFEAAIRTVGRCQDVARVIHGALSRLGGKPEYLTIRSKWDYPVFKMPDGTDQTLSHTGYHVVVKVEHMVYDAYTGSAGMRLTEYLSRIATPQGFQLETAVVSKP